MINTTEVNVLDSKVLTKFCPYKGEYDWLIECTGPRCMKYDPNTNLCSRS